jgi:hypothetical protein
LINFKPFKTIFFEIGDYSNKDIVFVPWKIHLKFEWIDKKRFIFLFRGMALFCCEPFNVTSNTVLGNIAKNILYRQQ